MRIVASLVGTVEICDVADGEKKRLYNNITIRFRSRFSQIQNTNLLIRSQSLA